VIAASSFQASLYLGLGTAIATFTAAAVALGLLTPRTTSGRLTSVIVLLSAALGITGSLATVANQQATVVAHVAIGMALAITATYVLMRALVSIFDERAPNQARTDKAQEVVVPPGPEPDARRVRRSQRALLASTALVAGSVVALLGVTVPNLIHGVFNPPQRLVVSNRVTDGALRMREDLIPVRLSNKPWTYCSRRTQCQVLSQTERTSNSVYETAECQTRGERTTNGNDHDGADDRNPGLFESTRYYGVRLDDKQFGYVSEVWVRAGDRGGLGLPNCPPRPR
jgi:hypothetical protein